MSAWEITKNIVALIGLFVVILGLAGGCWFVFLKMKSRAEDKLYQQKQLKRLNPEVYCEMEEIACDCEIEDKAIELGLPKNTLEEVCEVCQDRQRQIEAISLGLDRDASRQEIDDARENIDLLSEKIWLGLPDDSSEEDIVNAIKIRDIEKVYDKKN